MPAPDKSKKQVLENGMYEVQQKEKEEIKTSSKGTKRTCACGK
jgi:hypothetical protein